MLGGIVRKVIGTKNDRELKRLWPLVYEINALEEEVAALSDEELRGRTAEFRERLDQGAEVDDLLVPAFATAREAAKRVVGMRPFDVQLIGGMVLHHGKIAEMKTGEGKTLVATLPAYLNALTGRGVHVVTVNDYLARRDAEWMGRVYRFLGLEVGVVVHGIDDATRKQAYQADITYGQNNEFGFDYLRDNMKFALEDYVQRDLNYAIVDEVDSILIDEARTPLIISGPAEESTDKYRIINGIIPRLQRGRKVEKGEEEEGDYAVDEKTRAVILTEQGVAHAEELLGIDNLYDPRQIDTLHHVTQGLRAHALFKRDIDYVVNDGEVIIVDEFTGRMMPGRRWSDGLHQAVEAKEGLKVQNENQTLATITFQNYFRMYKKLAGMTGTADTESIEFKKIYNLDVMVIPTHRPMVRDDHPDVVYKTEREKFEAVIEDIEECHERGQPVLVGTISIEKSEHLSGLLKRRGIRHHVLNAKHHEREAEIIAQAGRFEAVTISTNMAGRGTDIVLGGNPESLAASEVGTRDPDDPDFQAALEKYRETCAAEREQVVEAGGLHIVGTERHESRRIDNQLRGRSGRQGDPGSSRFYLSLEDDLLRIFGAERIQGLMERLGMEEGVPIEHRMITRAVANAQSKVEGHNFDIRKHLLEYDDVMNKQREVIYHRRREALGGENLREDVLEMIEDVADSVVSEAVDGERAPSEWDWSSISTAVAERFALPLELDDDERAGMTPEHLRERIADMATQAYEERERAFGEPVMRHLEKVILLQTIDQQWKDHLLNMDRLKEGIGLRGYAQQNPLQAYQKEGFELFGEMIARIDTESVRKLFTVQLVREDDVQHIEQQRQRPQTMTLSHGAVTEAAPAANKASANGDKTGRNDPCPCGSGKKYKKCHGK
ncbi:MAG TPA: preprotein translocase subunit SecA [Candidatus Binatia bacterium]|nr:preprotein translocase subunit SecA [Candidatus Binatia bacterium]